MDKNQKLDIMQETLLTLLAIISVRLILLFAIDFTPLADYICKSYENQQYNEYIYAEGKVNEYVLDETSKLIAQGNVPKSLIHYFYEDGGMVYVTDKDLTEMCDEKETEKHKYRVLGFFQHEKSEYCIYFSNDINDTLGGTLEHEFGHYLDYLFGWVSVGSHFEEIFAEEKGYFQKNINSGEHYKTEKEYFAECYSVYLTDGKTLKKYCPRTYEIMELLTDQLETFYNMEITHGEEITEREREVFMGKAHVYEDGSYTDEIGNYFDKNGSILAEVGTDADFDRYSVEVQNGDGYYDSNGHFQRYAHADDY